MKNGDIVKVVYAYGPHPTDPNRYQEISEEGLWMQTVQGRDGMLDEILLTDGRMILCSPSRVHVRCFSDNPAYSVGKAELFPLLEVPNE